MSQRNTDSEYQLDDIDEQILFELMSDARNNTPPTIGELVGITPSTVRNRIKQLEEKGIIEGYYAHINFERAEGRLMTIFLCNVPFPEREKIARAAYEIPGVIDIRIMMGGRRSFHVLAVGEETSDLRRIGTTLSEIGAEIEDEMIVENKITRPYDPFSSDDTRTESSPAAAIDVPDNSEFVEVTVEADAPIAGQTAVLNRC